MKADNIPARAALTQAQLTACQTMRLPATLAGVTNRVVEGGVDLRYELLGVHGILPTETHQIGRVMVPSIAPIVYAEAAVSYGKRMEFLELASRVVGSCDADIAAIGNAVRVKYGQMAGAGPGGNAEYERLRRAVSAEFKPDAVLLRLAIMYVASCWASKHGEMLQADQQAYPQVTVVRDIAGFSAAAALGARAHDVAFCCTDADLAASNVISVLSAALQTRGGYATNNGRTVLPYLATTLPPTPTTGLLIFDGPAQPQLGALFSPSLVWEAASIWAGQHGVVDRLPAIVESVATMWFSTSPNLAPIYATQTAQLRVPASDMSMSIILPFTDAYRNWMASAGYVPQPATHGQFLQAAEMTTALGCAFMQTMWSSGLQYAPLTPADSPCRTTPARMVSARGQYCEAMVHMQGCLTDLGATGLVGGVLLGYTPVYRNLRELASTLARADAHQWEEAAPTLNKVPSTCSIIGHIDPLHMGSPAAVGTYVVHGTKNVQATSHTAMMRAGIVQGLTPVSRVGRQDGSVQMVEIHRMLSYRNAPSDWAVPPLADLSGVRFRPVLRVPDAATSLAVMAHTAEQKARRWYVDTWAAQPDDLIGDDFDEFNNMWELGPIADDLAAPGARGQPWAGHRDHDCDEFGTPSSGSAGTYSGAGHQRQQDWTEHGQHGSHTHGRATNNPRFHGGGRLGGDEDEEEEAPVEGQMRQGQSGQPAHPATYGASQVSGGQPPAEWPRNTQHQTPAGELEEEGTLTSSNVPPPATRRPHGGQPQPPAGPPPQTAASKSPPAQVASYAADAFGRGPNPTERAEAVDAPRAAARPFARTAGPMGLPPPPTLQGGGAAEAPSVEAALHALAHAANPVGTAHPDPQTAAAQFVFEDASVGTDAAGNPTDGAEVL